MQSLNRPFEAKAQAAGTTLTNLHAAAEMSKPLGKVQTPPSILKKAPKHSNVVPDPTKAQRKTTKPKGKTTRKVSPSPPPPRGSTAPAVDPSVAATILAALEDERKQCRLLEEKVASWMSVQTDLKEEAKKMAAREKAVEKALKKAEAKEVTKLKEAKTAGDGLRELKQLVAEMTAAFKNQQLAPAASTTLVLHPLTQQPMGTTVDERVPTDTDGVNKGGAPPQIIRYPMAPDIRQPETRRCSESTFKCHPTRCYKSYALLAAIPQDAMQALGESLPDTGAMPGTYGISSGNADVGAETKTFANQMGMMLLHLRVGSQGARGTTDYGVTMDTQWSSASRTQLRANMSEAKFDLLLSSFNSMETEYGNIFQSNVAGVLSFLPWLDSEMIEMYVVVGRLAQVFTTAMTNYRRLLEFIDKARWKNSWTYASIILNDYALKLHVIRSGSTKRLVMVLRTYILLREGASAEWMGMSEDIGGSKCNDIGSHR